ncbi:MAG: AMP-binding protein [Desulfonatronovibrionaceae bacterium]
MHKYSLEHADISLILSGMLKAACIARGEYPDQVFIPGPLNPDTQIKAEPEVAARARAMFGCPETLPEEGTIGIWTDILHRGRLKSGADNIVFFTSGSTGEPRPNTHDLALLAQEIDCQAALYPGAKRIISFVFPQHIYGFLFTIMLPKALGCPVYSCPPFPAARVLQDIGPNDLVVGFPLFWDKLLNTHPPLPPGIRGVTSTAPCPRETIYNLLAFGFEKITEIYGSSETGGIGTRDHPESPYSLLSCWRRVDQDTLARIHPGSGKELLYSMPDEVSWLDAQTFVPGGRKDNAVQVAGINVYPKRVKDILLAHPEVVDCAVRPMRPEEGSRLKAFIVPAEEEIEETEMRRRLAAWMKKKLSAPEVPRKIDFGAELPKDPMGKIRDW